MSSPSLAPDLITEDDDGIDKGLIAMNEEFEKMLNAEIDEVAEISSRKSKSPRSLSPASQDRSFGLTDSKGGSVKIQFDDTQVSGKPGSVDDSEHDDDDDDDDTFLEEMHALKEVERQIEAALRDENIESMDIAVQKIMNSPPHTKAALLQNADKRIIDRILDEAKHPMQNNNNVNMTMPESRIEQIIYMIRQDGLNAKEATNVLSVLCVLVWSLAFGLMRSVMLAEL